MWNVKHSIGLCIDHCSGSCTGSWQRDRDIILRLDLFVKAALVSIKVSGMSYWRGCWQVVHHIILSMQSVISCLSSLHPWESFLGVEYSRACGIWGARLWDIKPSIGCRFDPGSRPPTGHKTQHWQSVASIILRLRSEKLLICDKWFSLELHCSPPLPHG